MTIRSEAAEVDDDREEEIKERSDRLALET